ncbi:hypothetical protein [Clostridium sp. KNHs216]|uniref:hypothetical protein n=1 Tax=Clostridium sp. KNHs216 TaxID=1550235 RepID=UPI00114D5CB6|nr:hypothetical protein [Clostridium sp. KNHs216]TQI69032.1 hypothetical protein LY85_3782 [Clostridium sp. KNHs216]
MKAKLIGARELNFQSGDGTTVKGVQLYISFPEESVVGEMTDKLFLSENFALPACKPGDMLDITFNRKGKPETITVIGK